MCGFPGTLLSQKRAGDLNPGSQDDCILPFTPLSRCHQVPICLLEKLVSFYLQLPQLHGISLQLKTPLLLRPPPPILPLQF